MTSLLAHAVPSTAAGVSPVPKVLQRACACGGSAGVSGKCAGCDTQEKLGTPLLQPKLTVSAPDDPYEQEADAVAERVMRMAGPAAAPLPVSSVVQHEGASAEEEEKVSAKLAVPLQRDPMGQEEKEEEDEDEQLAQRKATAGAGPAAPAGFAATLGSQPGGAALPAAARSFFEPRFQRDLSHVRIHDGSSAGAMARDINARAFTAGPDIYFAPGQYDPASSAGRRLLAHELTHVFQQGGEGMVSRKAASEAPIAGDAPAPATTAESAEPAAAALGGGSLGDGPPAAADAPSGGGSGAPLPAATRDFFEARFGRDLGHVRVHGDERADGLARGIEARAFTHGSHIYFARGEYDPGSADGRRLLAHEIAHTAQPGRETVMRRVPAPAAGARPAQAPPPPAGVLAITMACGDMLMRVETAHTNYYYHMDTCQLPAGDYSTSVSVTGNDFYLDFGTAVAVDEQFSFSYRVDPGQTNPAVMLTGQPTVEVHVVDHLEGPRTPDIPTPTPGPPPEPACAVRLPDRELVPQDTYSHQLFEPISVPPVTLWSHEIPLGWYGWVQVEATASADVNGILSASYGPGRLTDICLTHMQSVTSGTAPIRHPLLGPGSHADSSTYGVGGRARFNLPAQANVNLRATGRLRIGGDYLSVIELAAAEGNLTAEGNASLSGSIDASVDVLARFSRNSATLEAPLLPLSVTIDQSSFDGVDVAAAIGLRGRAALNFSLNGGAAFSVLGRNLWSQDWNLLDFHAGVGWQGGLVYSPNPGLHWDLGEFDADDDAGDSMDGFSVVPDASTLETHEDAAEIDGEEILAELFEDSEATTSAPDGTPGNPLPFEWRKTADLYVDRVDLPNADSPESVGKYDGPTTVSYFVGGRLQSERLGVADWPAQHRTFQYMPYSSRHTPEQARFNRVLDTLGFDRGGLDAEHVWDVKLRGLGYDRFSNLWPASNQEQQLAGTQHDRQIRNYEAALGNVNGLHFEIVRVRHPGL